MHIQYTVRWGRPSSHLLEITMEISGVSKPELSVSMPAWVPGAYEILDSARHVQDFEVHNDLRQLAWKRVDKQTWQIDCRGIKAITVSYRVYANTVNCTASSYDATHLHITGGTVFLYVREQLHAVHELVLQRPPAGWKIATGLDKTKNPLRFTAPDYDTFIDCPIEIGPFHHLGFTVGGKKHHLVIHDYGHEKKNAPRLAKDCEKFVRYFYRLFGKLPYREYWFLCHFHPTIAKGGGLEHHNSTHISLPQFLDSEEEKDYDRVLEFASHEFFHLWNVKRLRPEGLGPFDYTKEVYTPNLWIAEGITEYYSDYALRRAGIWDRKKYLDSLAKYVDRLNDMPGEELMSLKESSFTTWTNAHWQRLRAPDEVNLLNSYVDYYTKGALIGWLLDLKIRGASKGKKSLDDVMRALWNQYGVKNKPYPEQAVEEIVEELAGKKVREWLQVEISHPKRTDFQNVLTPTGLKLSLIPQAKKDWEKEKRKIEVSTGIEIEEHSDGLRVINVFHDSPAESAGIDRGDLLVALDKERLTSSNWRALFHAKVKTKKIELALFRHHQLLHIAVSPQSEPRKIAKLELSLKASSSKKRLANSWLGP